MSQLLHFYTVIRFQCEGLLDHHHHHHHHDQDDHHNEFHPFSAWHVVCQGYFWAIAQSAAHLLLSRCNSQKYNNFKIQTSQGSLVFLLLHYTKCCPFVIVCVQLNYNSEMPLEVGHRIIIIPPQSQCYILRPKNHKLDQRQGCWYVYWTRAWVKWGHAGP